MGEGRFRPVPRPATMEAMHADPGSPAPLRVVVVDADDRVRESLSRLLGIGERLEVVGSAGEPEPALDIIRATWPDVVVVDPRLPEVEVGLDFIRRVRAMAPGIRVVVMSGSDTPQLDDLTTAADCVCRKTFRAGDLLTAILAAALLALR
jgi:DNA-binding NarL/FixJ family response regulator